MDEKKFTVKVFTRPGRPRSKRLRELGITAANISANNVINMNNSKVVEGHTHNNKSDIDAITIDRAGYLYITRPVFEAGPVAGTYDKKRVTEKVRAGIADLALDLATDSPIWKRFLSRQEDDTAEGLISFLRGANFGEYAPGLTGFGGHIDDKGRAELESLFLRSFLEVPELRYNRIKIITGEEWNSKGGGIIESVDEENKSFQLKLEAGEHPSVSEGDICKLVYNTGTGFGTCYFRVLSVSNEGVVRYALREGYDMHPKAMSHFVAYGNFLDASRQASAYSTTSYTRYLKGVNDWEIRKENIAMQFGDLSNLRVHGMQLEGYSAYLNNVYFTGTILQLSPEQIKEIADKVDSPYSVILSSYDKVVKSGSTTLKRTMKVVTGSKQVVTDGKGVTVSEYNLSTHITVLKGGKELRYSDSVEEGAYTVTLSSVGVTASVNAGNVIVTSIGENGGKIDILVNCEGKAIIPQSFGITVVKDGIGKYTESRYMHIDNMPEVPTGRSPKGWSKSNQTPLETIRIVDVRGFVQEGSSYVLDLINTNQGSISHECSQDEQYVTYHIEGKDHSGSGVYLRLFDYVRNKTLYQTTLYGSFDQIERLHIPSGVRAVLSLRGQMKSEQEQAYTSIRLTRADSVKCWEVRAEITPSVHDVEGSTETPTWSTPTLYKEVHQKKTRLTPSTVLSKLTTTGNYHPSSFVVQNLDDDNTPINTSLVLYVSSDGVNWVRKKTAKNTSQMTVSFVSEHRYYKVRSYRWVDDSTDYSTSYIHESNGVIVSDGKNGANGKPPRVSSDGYWEHWSEEQQKYVKTDIKAQGADGRVGAMPVPTGVYKQGREYYYNDEVRHIVLYKANGDSRAYPYAVRNYSPNAVTVPPTGSSTDPNWVRFNYFEMIATDLLLADGAYLAEFIFKGGKLLSQRGLFEGREVDLSDVPSDKFGAFIPNISMDGNKGDIHLRGSVASPFEWLYASGAAVNESVVVSRNNYNFFNGLGFTLYAHDNGKSVYIHNAHTQEVKIRINTYTQLARKSTYNDVEFVEIAIPPSATLIGIVVPDVRGLLDNPNATYTEVINGVHTTVNYRTAFYPITPLVERGTTPASGLRTFAVGHTVRTTVKEIKIVAAGRVDDRGSTQQKLGVFDRVYRYNTGRYRVYHNIGHTNYVPTVTTQGSGTLVAMLKNITGTYFEIEISDDVGNYEDGGFAFQCVAGV